MVRITPPLVYYDKVDGTYIKVGTGSWLQWLDKNSSFRYESFWGCFPVYKEYQGEEIFWLAQRQVKDEIRSVYLGESKDLTLDKLLETANHFSGRDYRYWERNNQTNKAGKINSLKSEVITKEIKMNAVPQWCIYYTPPDGRVEFMGGCWEKEQAFSQIQKLKKQAQYSESLGDPSYIPRGTYEVREELVTPVGYTNKSYEINSFDTKATTKEVEPDSDKFRLRALHTLTR